MELSKEEVEEVDRLMDAHMHGHAVSNNVLSWTCSDDCRKLALMLAINSVLKKPVEGLVAKLRDKAQLEFEARGPDDARGAAIWDVADWLEEKDGPTT